VSRIAAVLGVSRSHLAVTKAKGTSGRHGSYRMKDDEWLLPRIRAIVAIRSTYGYLRVTAKLNKELLAEGKARINPKRVYRIMRQNNLLLQRYTGKPQRTHEGQVITLRSNLRWCSDTFWVRCWNGEHVEVAFSLDCCDREVLSFIATTSAITGEMVRDLMVESVERRFGKGTRKVPQRLEWLSDNGPPYTAIETKALAYEMGMEPCTTPSYSPESNGMAEGFIKTFKRDYVYVNNVHDSRTVLNQLSGWFEDYNENHPHKGLKMQSPREFRRAQLST
jgi:putative transposase